MTNKFVERIINKYIPAQYREQARKDARLINAILQGNINGVKTFLKKAMQGYYVPNDNVVELTPEQKKMAKEMEGDGAKDITFDTLSWFIPGSLGAKAVKGGVKATKAAKAGATKAVQSGAKAAKTIKVTKAQKANIVKQGTAKLKKDIDDAMYNVLAPKYKVDKTRPEDVIAWWWSTQKGSKTAQAAQSAIVDKAATKGINKLTSEEEKKFAELLKDNASQLGKLADELGVKSKAEIPDMLRFVNQLGKLLENSPNYIKQMAKGGSIAGIFQNAVFSVYDLYQSYKENGTLIPENIAANIGRLGMSAIPGGYILKSFYGTLGYLTGDRLARAALKKLDVRKPKEKTTQAKEEQEAPPTIYEQEMIDGYRYPGLSNDLREFEQGQSGRKYHIVNDKIYDFGTGKSVLVYDALQDIRNYDAFKHQQRVDQYKKLQQQLQELKDAERRGYQVNPESYQQIKQAQQILQQEDNEYQQRKQHAFAPEYDDDEDLIEQYRKREVIPNIEKIMEQANKQRADQMKAYEEIFNKIAQDTYDDLDNYYTPENQKIEYWDYMTKAAAGFGGPMMPPEEFARLQKVKAMHELAPTMRDKALAQLQNIMKQDVEYGKMDVDYNELGETQRHNLASEIIDTYEARETNRHNKQSELIDMFEAKSGRLGSEAQVMNAITNSKKIPIEQKKADAAATSAEASKQRAENDKQMIPYYQAKASSEALYNASEADLPGGVDTFLKTNQSVMKQVYPEAFKTNNQQAQQPQQQQSNKGGFVQTVTDWLKGN